MNVRSFIAPGAFLMAAAIACPLAVRAERMHEVDVQHAIAAGQTLEVDDIVGSIVAEPSSGRTVTVHARATADTGDPGSVVRVTETGDRVVVCAVFPGDDSGSDGNCSHHDSGAAHDQRLHIDLRVGVPRGISLAANDIMGSITATRLDAPVNASNVSGAIVIATSATARAATVNGSIDARFNGRGNARFTSVNGAITLSVPRDADATFHAETLNGPISASGVSLSTQSGQFVGHSADVTLGNGKGRIDAHTVNGPIRLERR